MPNSGIDEVSSILGRMEGQLLATMAKVDALFVKHDLLNIAVVKLQGATEILGQQFMAHVAEDKAAHAKIEDVEETIEAAKNQAKGASIGLKIAGILGFGGGSAGLWAFVSNLLEHSSTTGTKIGH